MNINQAILTIVFVLLGISLFAEENNPWEVAAEANLYIIPDETYLNPKISTDKGHLHLEVKYNDEDLDTASVFAGYNFHAGEKLELNLTPMIGGVFGNSNGVAPGLLLELNYWKLTFSSEAEYFFSSDEKESNFFYSWSEFMYSPADWVWFGLAGQRTRAYQTDLEIQRGFGLGFGNEKVAVTGYLMNLGWDDAFAVITVEYFF
jgi:hypothetical protein